MDHKPRDAGSPPLVPGSLQARRYGCVCPDPAPEQGASSNLYYRNQKCPVHRPSAYSDRGVWEVERISLPRQSGQN
jgi:hypothetical protein